MHTIETPTVQHSGNLSGSAQVDVAAKFRLEADTRVLSENRSKLLNLEMLRLFRDTEEEILELTEEEAAAEFDFLTRPSDTGEPQGAEVHPRIEMNKRLRQVLDDILQDLKANISGRHHSLAHTHIEDAIMRLGMDLKQCRDEGLAGSEPDPYPNSYNAASPVVEPPSGELRL